MKIKKTKKLQKTFEIAIAIAKNLCYNLTQAKRGPDLFLMMMIRDIGWGTRIAFNH